MPHAGAYLVSDLTQEMRAIHCPKCGREGRYKREALLTRFGPDTALPDVLNALADCPRRRNMSDPCAAVYGEPLDCL